jgi:DNA polymerase-2
MNGDDDEQLVYRKRLRRPLANTSATCRRTCAPRGWRMSKTSGWAAQQYQQRGTIKYVWTTSGPEPVDYQQSPLDYEHYLTAASAGRGRNTCPSSTMILLQ